MSYRLRLKELRQRTDLNQEDMAPLLGISLSTYRTWEQGVARITLENAVKICEIIGCTPNDLCGWYDEHPKENAGAELRSHYDSELKSITDQMDEKGRELLASNARWLLAEHPGEESEIRLAEGA